MAIILNIETATTVCSVALAKDGKLLAKKELNEGYTHAENLTVFIQDVFKESQLEYHQIDAIAISKGPGSYTGLRIGVSTAKGLCFALNKPLIAINTLQHLSLALSKGEGKDPSQNDYPRFYTTDSLTWNTSIVNAKEHRTNPTEAENIMWKHFRSKQLGYKIRRQHPIGKFIADFVCIEKKVIIEIDGKIHEEQKEQDHIRTLELNEQGFKVIRFTNEEVISNIDNVIEKTKQVLSLGEDLGEVLFCPMIDARRMEVYCAIYDSENKEVRKTSAEIIDENSFSEILSKHKIIFFGDGAAKCKTKLSWHSNALFVDDIYPSATNMIELAEKAFAEKSFEDVAYFEPYYLKDFVSSNSI